MRIIFLEVQIWPGGAEHWLVSKQQVTNTSSERSDPDADFPSGLSNNADASPPAAAGDQFGRWWATEA